MMMGIGSLVGEIASVVSSGTKSVAKSRVVAGAIESGGMLSTSGIRSSAMPVFKPTLHAPKLTSSEFKYTVDTSVPNMGEIRWGNPTVVENLIPKISYEEAVEQFIRSQKHANGNVLQWSDEAITLLKTQSPAEIRTALLNRGVHPTSSSLKNGLMELRNTEMPALAKTPASVAPPATTQTRAEIIKKNLADSKAARESSGFKKASEDMTKVTEEAPAVNPDTKKFWTPVTIGGASVLAAGTVVGGATIAQNVGGSAATVAPAALEYNPTFNTGSGMAF